MLARSAIGLIGLPMRVEGLDRLAVAQPRIVVANPAGYLDAILLDAVLPPDFSFIGKRDLAAVPLIGPALRQLGVVFVERVAMAATLAEPTLDH